MALYRVTFERLNFGFEPALTQSSDVVFSFNGSIDDEGIEEAAWNVMWEQNPHWKNPEGPVEGRNGWSSVFCGNKFDPA